MEKEILKKEDEKVEFPSNSHKNRTSENSTDNKEVRANKVVTGRVLKKKKSIGRRIMDTFIGEDIDDVGSYILHDVLIPAAKSTISEMVEGGIEMLLFGEKKGSRTRRSGDRSYVSYDRYSSRGRDRDKDRREVSSKNRARHDFDEILLKTRGEAEEVLSNLVDLTIDYGEARVSDFYDLVGISSNYTDNEYGWVDLSSASVSRVRDGYIINLPKTRPLR